MLNQKTRTKENIYFPTGTSRPTFCEIQHTIGKSRLPEPEANQLLRNANLPEIAGYLIFSYTLNLETDKIPDYDLGQLLLLAIHGELLHQDPRNLDIKKVKEEMPLSRHSTHLGEREIRILLDFIDVKVLPLVIELNYQSIATALIDSIIEPYRALGPNEKLILRSYIRQTAHIGQLNYQQSKNKNGILPVKMGAERKTQIKESDLDKFIEELRQNWRIEHPTKFEQLLSEFRKRGFQAISTEDIADLLFSDSEDPERAVQFLVSKLNTKLDGKKLRIERFSSYELRRSDDGG